MHMAYIGNAQVVHTTLHMACLFDAKRVGL